MIEEYRFGSITIDGKNYSDDVEVRWTPKGKPTGQAGEVLEWWRKESHLFDLEDIQRALEQKPEILVFGTGAYGVAKLSNRAKKEIERKGIQLIIDKTGEAVKIFNTIIKKESKQEKEKQKRVIGLFHLTC